MIKDFHTHNPLATDAIINLAPGDTIDPQRYYSAGIHPWNVADATDYEWLDAVARLPQVVAIGETGLDALCDADEEQQMKVLLHHIALSEELGKPLILHVVRRHDVIMALKKRLRPTQPWVLHGYRGKPQLTRQLLSHGFFFSIGEKFNPASLALIPADRLLFETDESTLSIDEIAAQAGHSPIDVGNTLRKLSDHSDCYNI